MDVRHNDRLRRAWVWVILPLIIYALAAGIVTWPLARQLNTHAAGTGYSDTYEVARMAWEAKAQLLAGENPLHHVRIAYPDGVTSRVMWSTPLRWFPVMLLALVLPPVTAFNVWLIVTLVLNGLAAYWLALALARGHVPAALLGGLVFAVFPTLQGHLSVGHIGVLAVYGLPLFVLYWWRALFADLLPPRDGLSGEASWREVLWGGVWFAVAALGMTSQVIYLLLPVILFSGLYALVARGRDVMPRGRAWHRWPVTRAAAMIAVGGAIMLVFFGPLLTPAGRAEVAHLKEAGRVAFSTDLLAFVSPSPFGPLADLGLVPGYARDVLGTNSAEGSAYLGLVVVALALVALLTQRAARPWLVIALGAMVLSLGPLLKWRGDPVTICFEAYESYVTMPWAAVQDFPVVRETRTPGRFNMVTALACAALVSLGARAVLRRIKRPVVAAGVSVLLGGVMLLEFQLFWPYETVPSAPPDYAARLASLDGVDAVYNVPAQDSLAQMQAMAQQTVHGKPMIAGQLNRRSPQDPAILAVLDRALLGTAGNAAGDAVLPPVPGDAIPALLRETGADRVILHKRFVPDAAAVVARLRGVLGDPEFEDAQIAVFIVPESAVFPGTVPVLAQGRDGWSAPVRLAAGTAAFMGDQAAWHFYAPETFYGELVIPAQSYALSRKVALWLDGRLLAGLWAEPQAGDLRVPLWVESGFHTLRFEALEECTPYPFSVTCLGGGECRAAEPPECISAAFGVPAWQRADSSVTPRDVTLDHGVRLRGYDVQVTGDSRAVRVRLFWDAPGALPQSYALFVHLTRPDDPAPLAQHADYPAITTDAWHSGAAWVSDVVIELGDDIPPGEYALNAGWFVPESGERLAVRGDGPLARAGIVRIATVTVE